MTPETASASNAAPAPPENAGPGRVGPAVLAVLVVSAAVWLGLQPAPGAGATPVASVPPAAAPADLPGFRADAWFLPDDALLGFAEIPAGPFLMGADPAADAQAFDNERWPGASGRGTVDLPAYLVGRYEVTVAQFAAFAAAAGFAADPRAFAAPPDHPVAHVSWSDALAYCRWLDAEMRDAPQTPAALADRLTAGWQVTLPSEAQWEKAARGTDGRRYPWGAEMRRDRAAPRAGTAETRRDRAAPRGAAAPVGSVPCPECPWGLLDMSGNVWEWTRSPHRPYPFDAAARGDLAADALWVMRGGSYTDPARNRRTTTRGAADPGARRPFIGFRVALSPPGP